jgi:hypothetical protein
MGDFDEEMRFTGMLAEARGEGGRWIEVPFDPKRTFGEAKRESTRASRAEKAVAMLRDGTRHP